MKMTGKPLNYEQKAMIIEALRIAGVESTKAIRVINLLPVGATTTEERDMRDATMRARAHAVEKQEENKARHQIHRAQQNAKIMAQHGY